MKFLDIGRNPLKDGFKIILDEMQVLFCFRCSNFSFHWGKKLRNFETQKMAEASPGLG